MRVLFVQLLTIPSTWRSHSPVYETELGFSTRPRCATRTRQNSLGTLQIYGLLVYASSFSPQADFLFSP